MREIDQVRITLLRMFRGAVQLPQEIIDEMLKAFLHTRNAAIKVQAKTKGYLVRFNPYNYMDDPAAKAFSYILGKRDGMNWVGLYPSMYHRNSNMMMVRWRYRDAELQNQRWSLSCNMMMASSERERRHQRRQFRGLLHSDPT